MPNIVAGNTGAPAMMIGERGADFIKKDQRILETKVWVLEEADE